MKRSEELIDQYRQIHATQSYGQTSELLTGLILKQISHFENVGSIVDFGCGQARTADWIGTIHKATVYRYDPAIPDFSTLPKVASDLVLCVDVLEHIPLEDIDTTLRTIRDISENAFFNISCVKAAQILPNGENAHCTVRPPRWWNERLGRFWPNPRQIRALTPNAVTLVTWPRPETR